MPDQDSARVQATEAKPVVWTPEDANRFLTAAIHEANRPLEEQLKRRPLPANWILAIVAFVVFAGCVVALLLSSQLEKTEARAEVINRQREELLTQKVQLEAKSTLLEERLSAASDQVATLSAGNEELRGAKNDVARFRRQNELLRNQISGLEMEKTALARQLEAVKAMAIEDSLIEDPAEEPEAEEEPEPAEDPETAKEPETVKEPEPAPAVILPGPEPAPVPEPVEEKPVEAIVPPEPEPVVTPEPEPEPVVTPEPVPEPVVVAEPEPVVVPEPEPAEPVAAEPAPMVEETVQEEQTAEEPAVVEKPPVEEAPVPEPIPEPVSDPVIEPVESQSI